MARDDFTFFHALRVRWAEVDRQDVVFNGHYFLYFDVAIGEYWRAIERKEIDRFSRGLTRRIRHAAAPAETSAEGLPDIPDGDRVMQFAPSLGGERGR